jgi:hypothetical protein
MRPRLVLSAAVAAATLMTSACAGTSGTLPSAQPAAGGAANSVAPSAAKATNVIANNCFDKGTSPWTLVKGADPDTKNPLGGKVEIVSGGYGTCKHAAFEGTTAKPAPNGFWGVSQNVTVTKAGNLTWWYWGASTEEVKYGSQQVNVIVGGKTVAQCYSEDTTNPNTDWKEGKCNLSKYAGQKVTLEFGVYDNGYDGTQVDWYVSNISLT